jgi:hypothetical protein
VTPVHQTVFSDKATGIQGNCQTAALASLFNLTIEQVPYFFDFPDFWDAVFQFIFEAGYEHYGWIRPDPKGKIDWSSAPGVDGYFIVAGPSPRFEGVKHAVIYDRRGVMVHDPHPSNAGILYVEEVDDIRRRPT